MRKSVTGFFQLVFLLTISLPLFLVASLTGWGFFDLMFWNYRVKMRRSRRYVAVKELRLALVQNRGTFIIDHPSIGMGLYYVWWTPDDILSLAPVPPPPRNFYAEATRTHLHEFDEWLWNRYLNLDTGQAMKVGIWNLRMDEETLQTDFPGCPVLRTWSGARDLVRRRV
jgi:hypothetical protein